VHVFLTVQLCFRCTSWCLVKRKSKRRKRFQLFTFSVRAHIHTARITRAVCMCAQGLSGSDGSGLTVANGLKVGFVGDESEANWRDTCQLLELAHEHAPIDLLLTAEWPKGVALGFDQASASARAAHTALVTMPRYHCSVGKHYQRPPYTNESPYLTRFYSLAPAFTPSEKVTTSHCTSVCVRAVHVLACVRVRSRVFALIVQVHRCAEDGKRHSLEGGSSCG
jgi:hypothetical protein